MKTSRFALKGLNVLGLLIVIAIFATPFVWMAVTSVKSLSETITFPPVWVPETIRFENFALAWDSGPFLRYFVNSLIVTLSILVLQLFTIVPAAYAFARYRFFC